jgi:hypothetical protein
VLAIGLFVVVLGKIVYLLIERRLRSYPTIAFVTINRTICSRICHRFADSAASNVAQNSGEQMSHRCDGNVEV